MELKWELVGTIDITSDKIDITDPCYDRSVWCRTTKPIIPGKYNCFVGNGNNKYCGERVYSIILLSADMNFDDSGYGVKHVADIGVDAGLAGFFENKPDYSDSDWSDICNLTLVDNKKYWLADESTPLRCKGFFSESGEGDGAYDVYKITKNRKLVGYKLKF